MNEPRCLHKILSIFILVSIISVNQGLAQSRPARRVNPALKTPLSQDILNLLANEISGQIIFNNEVMLAGAPWIREEQEFTETFYESQKIYDLVRSYGIATTRLDRFPRDRTFEYPVKGEFWILKPEMKLVARLEADTALIASSSGNVDLTGSLIYVPPISLKNAKQWIKAGIQEEYKGKIALMWSHPNREVAKALDAAGIQGVISFSSRERYFDPDQVVYARGSYRDRENLKFGFTISWRQWSELLEDVENGQKITLLCKTKIKKYQDKFETVFSWIPGTEPDAKGVIFTAHLFEGYTKRGANDNMGGCVVQVEILRALTKLITQGALPRPRRNIYFLWPNEISGTYEQIKQNPDLVDKLSININMDMVVEGARKNNAIFTLSECPNHLPNYYDALVDSIMNYVWRTNDIVYLPDSPRGRQGGQYFPRPMWEKNGSRDAFRYSVHRATGGSDHICFNNPLVGIPGVELNMWPDQWYHADTDTPDKSDPTQMKRIAFIGAASAWAAANCTDDVLTGLLESVSAFGFERIGKRELPQALQYLQQAKAADLQQALNQATNLCEFAVEREIGAVQSTRDIYSASQVAAQQVNNYQKQFQFYLTGLKEQMYAYAKLRASQIKAKSPKKPQPGKLEKQYAQIIPAFSSDVKAQEFYLESSERYRSYMKENPDALKGLKIDARQRRTVQNYINGKRSVTKIRSSVLAETGKNVDFEYLMRYLEFLKAVGWINY